ncbi:MAG: hypothetical protein KF720_01375 [Rubrivivax sp.]|nr:hypothetical protein [Rubrivivax sp.]
MSSCELGLTLNVVSSHQDLLDACLVRAQAYGHHMPELGQKLLEPDALDHDPGTTVFICRDKLTGLCTGTMRIQSSSYGPLLMEGSLRLPPWLDSVSRVEITRLAVRVGADPLTRLCLWKASYLFCMANQLQWMVVGARNEALIRNYRRLGFVDVFAPDQMMPLAHTGGLPHRILALDNNVLKRRWGETRHPLYQFFFETQHADLEASTMPVLHTVPGDAAEGRHLPALA